MTPARKHQSDFIRVSAQEQEFLDMVEFCEFGLPRQFKEWRRFFINEERYLIAAHAWLELRCQGVAFPRIEDDVDKGMMRQGMASEMGWDDWENELERNWLGDVHNTSSKPRTSYAKSKWSWDWQREEPLPLIPKIPAPSGLAGVDLQTVF